MEELRNYVRELLVKKELAAVIGYEEVSARRTRPVIITEPADARKLVFNEFCLNNLAVYLNRARIKELMRNPERGPRLGVVLKPCDVKAVIALMQENQVKREEVHIISFNCHGVVRDFGMEFNGDNLAGKCFYCQTLTPAVYDKLLGELTEKPKPTGPINDTMTLVSNMTPHERFEFFSKEFDKCIKCYACRAVCPMCYCKRCITDKTIPRWIESSAHRRGNFSWNLVRAFHLSGRCINCGECERACPVDIPLSLLNRKMTMASKELFGYEAGKDAAAPTLVGSFDAKDRNEIFM